MDSHLGWLYVLDKIEGAPRFAYKKGDFYE